MSIGDAIILGLVQGLTEFLPVSSSGHLVLARSLFGIEGGSVIAFDAVLHLATLCAVMLYFSKDISILVQVALRKLGRLPVNPRDEILLYALSIGTLPAVCMGFIFESYVEVAFYSPLLVAGILFCASCFFIYGEWRYMNEPRMHELNLKKGFQVGLFQVLALLPGFSRSGATIVGGMLVGLSRHEAARFSFLLSIPIIFGVGVQKLFMYLDSTETIYWIPVLVGSIVAFVSALLVIHVFLAFIKKYSFWPFIWYTLILSLFILFVFWFG